MKVIWFTGLSGSGKTTIALKLKKELEKRDKSVEIIDGDVVRETLHKHLRFSRKDIRTNNKLIAEFCVKQKCDFVLVPIISPYREDRKMAKELIGSSFIELYLNCSLEECIKRDVKGLYKKALNNEIKNFIGVHDSNPYEIPENPDIIVNTIDNCVKENVFKIMDFINK